MGPRMEPVSRMETARMEMLKGHRMEPGLSETAPASLGLKMEPASRTGTDRMEINPATRMDLGRIETKTVAAKIN